MVVHEHNASNPVFGIRWPVRALHEGFGPLLYSTPAEENGFNLRWGQLCSIVHMIRRAFRKAGELITERAKATELDRA